MNPLRRKPQVESAAEQPDLAATSEAGKGRPTPKRRTKSAPPAPAPRTRKEAAAWQKSQRKASSTAAGRNNMTTAEYRKAMKSGDPRVLPKRDQGPARALARDYVDTHRMASNYLLLLLPMFLLGAVIKPLEAVTVVLFFLIFFEWFVTGGRIKKLAVERGLQVREGAMTLGLYAGGRAYFPRSWRRPEPRLKMGDKF